MTDLAHELLAEIDISLKAYTDVTAHGVALIDGDTIVDAAGLSGLTLAAPAAIASRLKNLPPPPNLAITNDPYASGVRLDHVFFVTRKGASAIVTALTFRDFGAMRSDVFRRRAETFHEGLNLSLLTVDWDGPDRNILLDVISANIRNGTAMREAVDHTARWAMAACARARVPRVQAAAAVTGKASGHAEIPLATGLAVDVTLDCSGNDWRLGAHFSAGGDAPVARCASASLRSASVLGIADALSMPPAAVLPRLKIETGKLAAVAPEAVNDGGPLAYACYQAAFDAARKLSRGTTVPRNEEAFRARH